MFTTLNLAYYTSFCFNTFTQNFQNKVRIVLTVPLVSKVLPFFEEKELRKAEKPLKVDSYFASLYLAWKNVLRPSTKNPAALRL